MKKTASIVSVLVSLLVLCMLLPGCGQPAAPAEKPKEAAPQKDISTIKIGVIAPLTGPMQFDGQSQVNGVRMAVDEVNKAGGILGGRLLTVVAEDGKGEPTESVSAAEKLITRDKVTVIQGAHMSTATKAVMPLLEKYKVAMVEAIATVPDLTEGTLPGAKYLFRTCPHVTMESAAVCDFMVKTLNAKKMAMLVRNDDWGRSSIATYKAELEKRGGQVVATEFFTSGESNFLPQLTKIKNTGFDWLFLVASGEDGAMIAKQIKEAKITKPVLGAGAFASDTFIGLAKTASEGIYGIVPYGDSVPTESNQAFVKAYRATYPKMPLPDKFAAMPYDATKVMIKAIELAGSTDPEKVRDALEKTTYDKGVTGSISFDAKHQSHLDMYITLIKGGKVTILQNVSTK